MGCSPKTLNPQEQIRQLSGLRNKVTTQIE